MPDSGDKVAERWWGRFLFGFRIPSQGVSHEDISGNWFVAEHKYRDMSQYSAEFRKAVKQHDENREREPKVGGRKPLICFTFHGTRGINARRFLMIEIFPKDQDIRTFLATLIDKIDSTKEV